MFKRAMGIMLAVLMMVGSVAGCSTTADSESKGTVKLAYVNWVENIAMTNLAKAVLEDKMGYTVELTMADIAPVFASLASGDSDAFLDVSLPVMHKSYVDKYGEDMVDLGVCYDGVRSGLVVPAYVEIDSIEQLNDNRDLFNGEIVGIDAGAGIMASAEQALVDYALDYELLTGSGPVMTAALGKAIDAGKPILVTGWMPHWKFSRWDLKMLEDPKGAFGPVGQMHSYSRLGLEEDMPEVVAFLKHFKMTEAELGDLMSAIENDGGEPLDAARTWMNSHTDLIDEWLNF